MLLTIPRRECPRLPYPLARRRRSPSRDRRPVYPKSDRRGRLGEITNVNTETDSPRCSRRRPNRRSPSLAPPTSRSGASRRGPPEDRRVRVPCGILNRLVPNSYFLTGQRATRSCRLGSRGRRGELDHSICASAWFRSLMMSSMCSMPTDRRTSCRARRRVSDLLLVAQLRVRRRGRVDRVRLRVADVRDVREELERVDHLLAGGAAALEADDDEGPPFPFK